MEKNLTVKVLLVDDEEGFITVLQKRLKRRGMDVRIATSGAQGILTLRAEQFDAAVLDLKLPDMTGLELLNIFKKMDPSMPVIILSGHGSEQAAIDGTRSGAFDYLIKPCEFEELLEKIRKAALVGREGK